MKRDVFCRDRRRWRDWRPWEAPKHWRESNKDSLRWLRTTFVLMVALFGILPALVSNYFAPGTGTLVIIIIVSLFVAYLVYVRAGLKDDFVYRQDIVGGVKRFVVGAVAAFLLSLPYGPSIENVLLAMTVFLLVNLLALMWFTYASWLNVDDAKDRFFNEKPTAYDVSSRPYSSPPSAPKPLSHGSVEVVDGSATGWLVVCRECMSLVGDEDECCWRCDMILRPQHKVYVALPRAVPRSPGIP